MEVQNKQASIQPAPSRLPRLLLVLLLCLSAYIQLTVAARTELVNPLTADSGRYFSYAYNVQRFGVYSSQVTWDAEHLEGPLQADAIRSPGYPAFLMLISKAEPTQDWAWRIAFAQAVLGVLTVWFSFLLARKIVRTPVAFAVALLTAFSPHLAAITPEILTEPLFTTVLMAATLASVRPMQARQNRWLILAGVLWGLAALVRPTAEFFPPLVLAATLLIPSLRGYRREAAIVMAAFALTLAPWSIRNQVVDLRPTKDNLTVNFLHHGSYPDFMYQGRVETLGFPYRADPDSPRIGQSVSSALHQIRVNFQSDPVTYARWYLLGKPISFLSWNIINGQGDIFTAEPVRSPFLNDRKFALMRDLMHLLHWPLMVLGLLGGLLSWLRPTWLGLSGVPLAGARLLAAILGYSIALHMIGAPFPRYSVPFRPMCYLLAMLPLAALLARALPPAADPGLPASSD